MAMVLRATGGAVGLDEAEVRRALAALADPARGLELRGLPSGRSRTLPGGDVDGLVAFARELSGGRGVYYCLGALPPTLDRPGRAGDVLARRWLLIDCDPTREKGANATDAEHEAARAVACEVMEDLCAVGWPSPLLVDSGNGWHLLYRIDLPATAHSQAIVRRLLRNLAKTYDTPAVTIDTSVSNANRHGKLPGTWARKGPHSAERPHRPVRLVHCPAAAEAVPAELLAELAGPDPAPRPAPGGAFRLRVSPRGREAYGRAALDREAARVRLAREQRNNALNRAAFNLFGLVAGGLLNAEVVERELLSAAKAAGLGEGEALATIASGRRAGLEQPRGLPESAPLAPATNGHHAPGAAAAAPVILLGSEVTPRKVEWLWPHRIPLGKLTTFAGIGGLGKTFVLCDIASRVSRGLPWPDAPAEATAAGGVLFISGEDDPDDTLVPRMIEMGADLSRVAFLRAEALDGFTLASLPTLDLAVEQLGAARLVVIDPPTAFLAGVDDHKNAELRSVLTPLKNWAARRNVALVFNTHVNKGSGQKMEAMMRVMGSVAWVNAVRSAHMFARDPDDHTRRLFVGMKNNLGKERRGLAYAIADAGELAKVEWKGEVDTTADQAVNREAARPKRVVASEWLVEQFSKKREWRSSELFDAAHQAGLSRDAVFQAKDRLRLPKARQEWTEGGDKHWIWWVPEDWEHLPEPAARGDEVEVGGSVSVTVETPDTDDTDTLFGP